MGLLDSVIGGLMGGNNGASSPMGSVLSGLLGGGQASGGQAGGGLGGLLGGLTGGGNAAGGGGLGGIVQQFENAGLGNVVQSWIGNGPNQSVSPQQLQNVFGHDQVQGMASQAGMQPNDFLSQLSQHLPNAVNGMTPNGQLSSDDQSVSV